MPNDGILSVISQSGKGIKILVNVNKFSHIFSGDSVEIKEDHEPMSMYSFRSCKRTYNP